jgi:nicotinamide-nucleotide amidase
MTLFDDALLQRAAALIAGYRARQWTLATAESCTGGLVAALLTEIAGSSDVVVCGLVTYANRAKVALLDVSPDILAHDGAVSAACAEAMAAGALARSGASHAVAVTGIAGPGGGSAEKPVGLVHFASASSGSPPCLRERRFGPLSRSAIRLAAVDQALALLESYLP